YRVLPRRRSGIRGDLPQRLRADRKPHRRTEAVEARSAAVRRVALGGRRGERRMWSDDARPGRIRPAPEDHLSAPPDPVRRGLLRRAVALGGGAIAAYTGGSARADDGLDKNLPPHVPEWSRTLGAPILASPYGAPSRFEANVKRRESPGLTRTPQSSVAFTPLQNLFGIITPSGLHFERHDAGIPDVDPHQHRLMIHGLVANPRIYTMDDIVRFPSVSRVHFIECGANTGIEWGNVAVPTV